MKPITFYDPVLLSGPIAFLRAKVLFLETQVAELEAQEPEVITVEVPGPERIVEVEVQVPSPFNGQYIQILRDHIKDLNDFIVQYLSESSE